MNKSIIINVSNSGGSGADDVWADIEQIVPPEKSEYATVRDVYRLWSAAVSGRSARTIRPNDCPAEFNGSDITVFLGFYVWPSVPDLPYQVSLSIGELSTKSPVKKSREYSAFLDNVDSLELKYYMEDVEISFESPCYDRYGSEIEKPTFKIYNGIYVKFSKTVFCGIRVKGKAIGDYYVASVTVSKEMAEENTPLTEALEKEHFEKDGEEFFIITPSPKTRINGYKISNLECTVSVAWMDGDEQETDQERLKIPKCVEEILAFCPDMYKTIILWCSESSTRQVYYNTCNGELILINDDADVQHYCTKVETDNPAPTVWGWLKAMTNA